MIESMDDFSRIESELASMQGNTLQFVSFKMPDVNGASRNDRIDFMNFVATRLQNDVKVNILSTRFEDELVVFEVRRRSDV